MALSITRSKHLTVDELPVWQGSLSSEKPEKIASYIKYLVRVSGIREELYLELPSPNQLVIFFGCSHMELYDAFQILYSEGFDYRLSGIDSIIAIWITEKD